MAREQNKERGYKSEAEEERGRESERERDKEGGTEKVGKAASGTYIKWRGRIRRSPTHSDFSTYTKTSCTCVVESTK